MNLVILTIIAASVFIAMVQMIQILYTLDNLPSLGPNIAVMLVSIMYGMCFVLLLLPIQSKLNVRIQEFISGQE